HLLRCFADRGFRSDDLHASRHNFPKLHSDSAISPPFFRLWRIHYVQSHGEIADSRGAEDALRNRHHPGTSLVCKSNRRLAIPPECTDCRSEHPAVAGRCADASTRPLANQSVTTVFTIRLAM